MVSRKFKERRDGKKKKKEEEILKKYRTDKILMELGFKKINFIYFEFGGKYEI